MVATPEQVVNLVHSLVGKGVAEVTLTQDSLHIRFQDAPLVVVEDLPVRTKTPVEPLDDAVLFHSAT